VDLTHSAEDQAFRTEVRTWLEENLAGDFAALKGMGGAGRGHEAHDERVAWNRHLAAHGWTCLGWPEEHGGRGLSLMQQVIFHEEYARADAPARVNHLGEELLGPTLIAFGTEEQKRRFLPPIVRVEELWCQGYSEPDAGSDLANVQTRAELVAGTDGPEWSISGQKIWTSLAHWADWCFALCRTDRDAPRHRGISYLLVPMRQAGVEIRPIEQLTRTSEFNETFFDDARTAAQNVVGEVHGGWRVAMGTLAFERGASTLGQQLAFETELRAITDAAQKNGVATDPLVRQRLAGAWIGLRIMRYNALRSLTAMARGELTAGTSIHKLYWASFHRALGELAVDVQGTDAMLADDFPYELDAAHRLFLWSRADTIYGGSNQVQRNVIGERALGLPPEPKVVV
jgi:alkylation response protein AidB-like acyl-CoA dehydrogenase